jgi:hypothetical protein
LPTLCQNTSFDGAQSAHFAAHRDLRLTVHVEDWLGQIAHKVVLAVAVWDPRKLGGDGLDERILLVRHPRPHRLAQALSPLTREDDHPVHLLFRTREQGLSKPDPLPCEFAHHIQRLMALFRLQSIDRQHQRRDIPVDLSEPCRVLLPGRQYRLVQANIVRDGIVGQPDLVRVL